MSETYVKIYTNTINNQIRGEGERETFSSPHQSVIAQPEGDGVWIFLGFFIPFLLLSPNKTDMSMKKFDAMRMGEILRRK